MADEHKSPVDKALDVLLFAPLGLALTAREELPNLIGKGRKQVETQVSMARMIGQFAAMQGRREAEKAAAKLVEQVGDVAERLGGLPGAPGATRGATVAARGAGEAAAAVALPAPAPASVAGPAPASVAGPAANAGSNGASNGAGHRAPVGSAAPPSGGRRAASGGATVVTADLAIPGYDTLSASQVVQRLAGLSRSELEAVRQYEAANRGRRTILSKVAQLQTDPS